MSFPVPAGQRGKIKENINFDEYSDSAREPKKLMTKGTVVAIVAGTFGTVPKGLEKKEGEMEIEKETGTSQTKA